MKRFLSFCINAVSVMLMFSGAGTLHAQSSTLTPGVNMFPFGINWMDTRSLRNTSSQLYIQDHNWFPVNFNYNLPHFFDSLGFNTYHMGGFAGEQWSKDTTNNPPGWSWRSNGRLIVTEAGTNTNDAIGNYSSAERMKYLALPKKYNGAYHSWFDTLQNFDFINYHYGNPWSLASQRIDTISPDHWQIGDSTSHNDVVVIDSNEILNAGYIFYHRMWVNDTTKQYRVAVKMQVRDLPTGTQGTDTVLSVWVILHRYGDMWNRNDSIVGNEYDTAYKFPIRWNQFTNKGEDQVFFSDPPFKLPVPKFGDPNYPYNEFQYHSTHWGDTVQFLTDVMLEIHSERWDTTRIAWATIEDLLADTLLAGVDLDPSNTAKYNISNNTASNIQKAEATMRNELHGKLWYYYLSDEAQISEFAAQGRVNEIIADSGETERGNYQERRYAAMVKPHTFRSGDWSALGGDYAPMLDNGPGYGDIVCYDGGGSSYTTSTLRTNKFAGFGYFPYSGTYTLDTVYALNKCYKDIAGGGNCTTSGLVMDSSFDIFDYSRHSFQEVLHRDFLSAMSIDSIIYLFSTENSPTEWWANIFMDAGMPNDSSGTSEGGYYETVPAAVPEELSAATNLALIGGAKGFLYWWGTTNYADGATHLETAFADTLGKADSDYETFRGVRLPVMFHRNCKWVSSYSSWLQSIAPSLYPAKWLGAFIRHGKDDPTNSYAQIDTISIGSNPITKVSGDSMYRPLLKHWWGADTVLQEPLPDSLSWDAYGFFQDTLVQGKTRYYLLAENLWCDPRDIRCHFVTNSDSVIVKRGSRWLVTTLNMDTTVSKWWRVTAMDTSRWDSVVAWNGKFQRYYDAGAARLYKIEPTNITIIDNYGVAYNNGVHFVKHNDSTVRIVYVRNDSVFARRIIGDSLVGEKFICRGGNDTITVGIKHYPVSNKNRNPVIARHRGNINEDLVVWERVDSSFNYPNEILGAVLDDNDNIIVDSINHLVPNSDPVARGNFIDIDGYWAPSSLGTARTSSTMSFLATPSVCGTDSGWVVTWADSANGIWVSPVNGSGGNYFADSAYLSLNAPASHKPAEFPSIAWGTEQLTPPPFIPLVHVVWQQPDTNDYKLIWHQTVEIAPQSLTSGYANLSKVDSTYLVSPKNDPWLCENTMPDVSVDARKDPLGTARNFVQIMWHAKILNDSLNPDRVRYRERFRDSAYSYIYCWGSGKRGFLEPSVFTAPTDTTGGQDTSINDPTLAMVWYSTLNSMHAYVPGETRLRSFPIYGKHPTLSYALWNDTIPSVLFQTPDSVYRADISPHSQYAPSVAQPLAFTRQIHSLGVEARHGYYSSCSYCCSGTGLSVRMYTGYPNYQDVVLPPVQVTPIQMMQMNSGPIYMGGGFNENQAVRSTGVRLSLGTPLAFNRSIIARNSNALSQILSTGHLPQILIELVDSATKSVLKILDSVTITSSTDTLDREGTIAYYPDSSTISKTVYVRARILADSTVAKWGLMSEMQVEHNDSLILPPLLTTKEPIIDNYGVSYSNGVHMVRHDGTTSRIVYIRNDSLFTRRVVSDTLYPEVMLAAGERDTDLCNGGYVHAFNRNPTIARHRAGVNEDLITWEKIDSSYTYGTIVKTIPVAVITDQDTLLLPNDPCLRANALDASNGQTVPTLSFLSTPVVCSTDSGWVVAWSDSGAIAMNTVCGGKGLYYVNSSDAFISASSIMPAEFPSIAWGNDKIYGDSVFTPYVHIVWQQPDSNNLNQIWHQTVSIPFYSSQVSAIGFSGIPEQVSERDNSWVSTNTMPSVSVDGYGNGTGSTPTNIVRITWHAHVMNDTASYDRVRYRERRGTGSYGAIYGYASGARGYLEPNTFISPADTTGSSLALTWYASTNNMYEFIPGQTVLHQFIMNGEHPTFSYATWKDTLPSVIGQTPISVYYAILATHDSLSGTTLPQTRQVNTVAVEAKRGGSSSIWYHGIGVSIADNHIISGSIQTISLASIPTTTNYAGNGVNENTAVKSNNFILHTGTPVVFDRWLIAKDTATLSKILSTGHHPQVLIEMVDSATGSVLAVLDSFTVSHPTDSVERNGTLSYTPTSGMNLHHAYIRARITADSNAAKWDVTSEMQFETSDTVGSGFAKQIAGGGDSVYAGRAGMVAVNQNPILLEAYPNPFRDIQQVSFTVPDDEDAQNITECIVMNMMAKVVRVLAKDQLTLGRHTVTFNAADLPNGSYILAVHEQGHMQSKLIILTK